MSYRIKTKEEFIRDYGESWISTSGWRRSDSSMDYLFGTIIPPQYNERIKAGESISIPVDKDFIAPDCIITTRFLNTKCITDEPLYSKLCSFLKELNYEDL